MASCTEKKIEGDAGLTELSKQDIRLLLNACTELVNVCAKLTGKIDPAATAMLAHVREDMASEPKVELNKFGFGNGGPGYD
jgi:hypothetical protein